MPNQKYSLKQIKEHLRGQAPLKFAGIDKPKEKNAKEFLKNFFDYNVNYNTIYVNAGRVQTSAGKRRSIGDIFRITYYYYPSVTLSTVYKGLIDNIVAGTALSAICKATRMRVYRGVKKGYEIACFQGERVDEYATDFNQFPMIGKCEKNSGWWGDGWGMDELTIINL